MTETRESVAFRLPRELARSLGRLGYIKTGHRAPYRDRETAPSDAMNPTDQHRPSPSFRGPDPQDPAALNSRPPRFAARPASIHSQAQPPERARNRSHALQLAFDSYLEPAPAGLRTGDGGSRHLAYLSDEFALALEVRPSRAELHGELVSRSEGPVEGIPAFLLTGNDIAAYASTGSLGDFDLAGLPASPARICLLVGPGRCLEVDLGAPEAPAT